MTSLSEEVRIREELRQRLLAEYGEQMDDETLADTLEAETNLIERITSICRAANAKEVNAEVLSQMIADMQARKARFIAGADHLRGLALWAMGEADIPKITAPDLTVSVGKGRTKVIISDLEQIPQHLCTFIAKPDTKAIREEIESGTDVPGASISNQQPVLSIRTK